MYVNQTGNFTHDFRMCSYEQLTRLHNASLEVLERTGVKIFEDTALKILAEGGAYVDFDERVVRIPAHMVKAAIQSAPSRIVVANPAGKRSLFLERNNVYFGTGTDLPTHMDPYTKEVRPTTLHDIENIAKVVDKAENFAYVSNQGLAQDIPQYLHDMITLKAMRQYCAKPNLSTATDAGNLKCLIDMCAEMAGGYEELKRSPSIMLYNEPVSPLMNSEEAIQKLMMCAEYGIPTTYASGGVSGGTSPVTLSGSIVCSNAECLAGLVLHQLIKKGAPFIYGYIFGAMDMMTIEDLANALANKMKLEPNVAKLFVTNLFDVVRQAVETERIVKVKGLGTFKLIEVSARESVNVNNGERVIIGSHGKISFTPDPIMKELVNKPFSQFETVVLNDGVDFDDDADTNAETQPEADFRF